MIGDRLETDILFGANCGLDTMLTLTGVSTMEEAEEYRDSNCPEKKDFVPDYVVETIGDFLQALEDWRTRTELYMAVWTESVMRLWHSKWAVWREPTLKKKKKKSPSV